MPKRRSAQITARTVLGLAIVTVGILLTLDNLGLVRFSDFRPFWPVVLLFVGIAKLSGGTRAAGAFWLILGTALLLPVVFEDLELGDLLRFWPLLLIAAGVTMVARSLPGWNRPPPSTLAARDPETAPDKASALDVDAFAFLSTVRRRVDTTSFRRADLTAVWGGCEIDLREAELSPDGAVVEVFAFWGGIELRIPDHWAVDPQLAVVMGSCEDKTRKPATGSDRLVIQGFALMGGLEVRN